MKEMIVKTYKDTLAKQNETNTRNGKIKYRVQKKIGCTFSFRICLVQRGHFHSWYGLYK